MTDPLRPSLDTLPLETLLGVIVEDARRQVAVERDRAANEARALVQDAELHVAELERAARELGRVRGEAAEEAFATEGDVEIKSVVEGAFDRLYDRFRLKVQTALESLRDAPRYVEALGVWARSAAAALDGPADVHAAPEDRTQVYEALLAAGAEDFQVHVDRTIRTGFVVRDLDGHLVLDRRPEGILASKAAELRALLRRRMPPPPDASREA